MTHWPLESFEDPAWHTAIAAIIRRRSTNPADVREVALSGLELSRAQKVLDLGCGFGFMTEVLSRHVAPNASIVGLDACPANEQPYLSQLDQTSRTGRFICQRIDSQLDWPDDTFDLIVASYSLYFFPQIIPEVARVLAGHGTFVALTHMEASCRDLRRITGAVQSGVHLLPISRGFSGENGGQTLSRWFGDVDRIDYVNSLRFDPDTHDDLRGYLRFKLPFLLSDSQPRSDVPEALWNTLEAYLRRQGRVVLAKNDAVFRCRLPRCP